MKKQKGVTLLELLLAIIIIGLMCTAIGSIHLFLTRAYKSAQEELGEFSATAANNLEFMSQRIMRADSTKVQDKVGTFEGSTLWVNMPLSSPAEGTITCVGNELRYFPGKHILKAEVTQDDIKDSTLLASNVRYVTFKHDLQSESSVVIGNPEADGIWAPIFFITFKSPPRVAMTLALGPADKGIIMQTAAVPRISAREQQVVRWLSPVVKGKLLTIKELNGAYYALVEAESVAIHTPEGFLPSEGQVFYVGIPLNLGRELEGKLNEQIAFMGDILFDVEGKPAMRMNNFYGGGVLVGKEEVEAMCRRIEAGKEDWYQRESLRLKGPLGEAKKKGTDISDWKEVWYYLQRQL